MGVKDMGLFCEWKSRSNVVHDYNYTSTQNNNDLPRGIVSVYVHLQINVHLVHHWTRCPSVEPHRIVCTLWVSHVTFVTCRFLNTSGGTLID